MVKEIFKRFHRGADYCVDPDTVYGVLFSSQGLKDFPTPFFPDIPPMVFGNYLDHTDLTSRRFSAAKARKLFRKG